MNFVHKPYLPVDNIKAALVDYRIGIEVEETLGVLGIETIKTIPCKDLYDAINGHPDIVVHHIGDNKLVVAPNVFDELQPVLSKKGFALTKGETWLNRNYPENVAYNVLRVGSLAFHNTKYTDKSILIEFEKNEIDLIHVNQGYTKCSTCIVDENTIITSDYKIAKTVEKYGIESILIKPGGIILSGFDYGFIGGCSGLISRNTMAFTGNLDNIQDNYKIYDILKSKGIDVKILSTKQIFDIGSIIPLTY
jgi:virulence-associated protein VapD